MIFNHILMKTIFVSAILISLFGTFHAGWLSLGTITRVANNAVHQVVAISTGLFHEVLYPILRVIPDFDKVFPPSMDPEEAEKTCRGAVEYFYNSYDLLWDEDLVQGWTDSFKRFAIDGFSSDGFVRCFSAMFGDFLTNEKRLSLDELPELATNYVHALIETLGFDEEEKRKGIDVVSPYHAALAKANVMFLKSVNPNLDIRGLDSLLKAYFDELDKPK